jgi:UDP-N-acetyl-2-amino-2-deoxyglucuronate dehydrogenase
MLKETSILYYMDLPMDCRGEWKGLWIMLRSAIIGCGAIAPVHAHALAHLSNVELAACADIQPERAKSLAGQYGANAYSTMEELLDRERIDVVHLCTPHYLHVPMAVMASKRGIHVFSEKPPAIDREQWTLLQEAAKKVRVGICFQNRYNGSVQKMKALIAEGSLGKVLGVRAVVTWERGAEYYLQSGWRGKCATEGGGVLINQAIHTLDLITYFLGRPEEVFASTVNRHLKGVIEVEDTVEAYMKFQGAPVLFYASTAFCINSPVFMEIAFEHAMARMEKDILWLNYGDRREERFDFSQSTAFSKDYWGNAHEQCICDFYEALESGRDVPINPENVQDTVEAMFSIYGR